MKNKKNEKGKTSHMEVISVNVSKIENVLKTNNSDKKKSAIINRMIKNGLSGACKNMLLVINHQI